MFVYFSFRKNKGGWGGGGDDIIKELTLRTLYTLCFLVVKEFHFQTNISCSLYIRWKQLQGKDVDANVNWLFLMDSMLCVCGVCVCVRVHVHVWENEWMNE